MLAAAADMLARGDQGVILSLLCESGESYLPTYDEKAWRQNKVGCCVNALQHVDEMMKL